MLPPLLLRSIYYTVITTDRHKASRGLSAIVKLGLLVHIHLHSTRPLILIVLSRLDRGIQSATEMLPLKRGRGVAVLTAPPRLSDMRLADALVSDFSWFYVLFRLLLWLVVGDVEI